MGYQTASLVMLWLELALSGAVTMETGRTHNHGHYVCSTWGRYHFKTFDRDYYQFPGKCSYNFASDCRSSYKEFSVHVHRSANSDHPLIDKITITIKDVIIQLKTTIAVVDGVIANTPYFKNGIHIKKGVAYIKVYTKMGFTLMWNKEEALMVELDPKYKNMTCGLCGDYNGIQEFPLKGSNLKPIQFGNLHNIHDPYEKCIDLDETKAINTSTCNIHRSVCEEHLRQAAFSNCRHLLNEEAYINACMLDMCSCGQSQDSFCLCSTISEYSRQCSHAGGRPGNWRTDNFCPRQCPANMIYQESASPCKNSCSHLEIHSLCEEHYMDGCVCPEGTVLDDYTNKGCIAVSKCNCKFQDDLYVPGATVKNDCDECRCISGKWNCTDRACPRACSVEGGSHVTTFDGKSYTFHGDCYYVLSQGIQNDSHVIVGEITSYESWRTSLKSITVLTDNQKNMVTFKADGTVLLNQQRVTLPQVTDSFSIAQPSDSYINVQATFGMQMQIQLMPMMQVHIIMDKSATGQLQGLCGNFNYKETDDLQISGGLLEATASAFGNTWKIQSTCRDVSDRLDDPCSLSIESKNYADHWCSMLEKNGPFAKCHSTIDPTVYALRCHYDTCNCKDSEKCMCAALSSYVIACAAKGVIMWGWRKGICDKDIASCPSSQIYLYNLTTCQPTCRSLAEGEKACARGFTPVDGCGCPDGEFLNEKDQCVPISQCSCYNDGSYVKPMDSINKRNERCTCHNGKLHCSPSFSKACPQGKVYYDCNNQTSVITKQAPNQRSCKTLDVDNIPTACLSGCVCPNGLLDDGAGGCVPEERCPCSYKKDIYSSGTQIKVDCNTCYCQSGRWTCTDAVCYGTCSIYGSGHYITFDEKLYDFEGNCEFVAAQDYCGPNYHGSFSIITENIPCGTTGVTCSKSIKVFLGDKVLKLADEHLVESEGHGVNHVSYLTREVGIYLVIEANNGIFLIWDKKTTMFIKVSPAYKGKLCGLCGNFDDNSQNDFTTSHMLQVSDVLEFGNSWKVDSSCPDAKDVINPCSVNPHRKSWAEKQCGLIKSNVFKICHSKVDPQPFYDSCVKDACSCDSGGDCECFCTSVAAYAQECTKAGACVYWRTPDICPIFCDYYNPEDECEWHYHPCGNGNIKTCRSINNVYTNVTITYLEGCYPTCPEDKPVFDESKRICVPPELCGCYVNNTHYDNGIEVPRYKSCHTCKCTPEAKVGCIYNDSACFCSINGTIYQEGEVISRKEQSGVCIVTNCVNGTANMEIEVCVTSTPNTTSVTTTTIATTLPRTTVTTTPLKTSPVSTTCAYEQVCRWTQWFDVSKPSDGLGSGDFETYDNIRKYYQFCSVPEQIECRAVNDPSVHLKDLKQNVQCNVSNGLICKNSEQNPGDNLWRKCYNYKIRVTCCDYECIHPTSSIIPTTVPTSTTTPTTTPYIRTIETTPVATTGPKTTMFTKRKTTTFTDLICDPECVWSQWFDVSTPKLESNGGDYETYVNIRNAGFDVCESPKNISCRSTRSRKSSLESNGQNVMCDVSTGFICKNNDQSEFICYNYEISVYCCHVPDNCITTPKTTPSTSSLSTFSRITPTSESISTKPPIPPSTMMTTSKTSAKTSPSCVPVCSWSQWYNVSYPDPDPDGGEYETYENIRKKGFKVCERPKNISCRSQIFFNQPLEKLGQKVTCDVSFGLVCHNEDQIDQCLNYEISVYCCDLPAYCTVPQITTTPQTTTEFKYPTSTTAIVAKATSTTKFTASTPKSTKTTTKSTTHTPKSTTATKPKTTKFTIPTRTKTASETTTLTPMSPTTTETEIIPSTKFTNQPTSTVSEIIPSTKFTNQLTTTENETTSATEFATPTLANTTSETTTLTPMSPTAKTESIPSTRFTTPTLTKITSKTKTGTPMSPNTTKTIPSTKFSNQPTSTVSETIPSTKFTTPTSTNMTMLTSIPPTTTVSETTTEPTTASEVAISTTRFISEKLSSVPLTTTVIQRTSKTTETTPFPVIINTPPSAIHTTASQEASRTITPKTSKRVPTTTSISASSEITTTWDSTTNMTSPCVCMYNKQFYPQGEISSGVVNEVMCYKVTCSEGCKVHLQNWICKSPSTTIPASTVKVLPTSSTVTTPKGKTSTSVRRSTVHTTAEQRPDCLLEPRRKYNETWKIDNCTTARCLGNTSVDITYKKCKIPPPIKCANRLAPKLVTNADDQCCQQWECPCECYGWGDPHFKTFDGTFYSFQGICTYTLVEEIIKKISNFGVYIDNYDCGSHNKVSCPHDIIVKYEAQTVRIAAISLSPPELQVLVNEEVVGIPYEKHGVKVYKSELPYVVEIPSIQSFIEYDGLRFSVKLPYSLFAYNTQGQCGTCSNNRSDDCLKKSGEYVSKCEQMASTWLVSDPKKPNCATETTTVSPIVTAASTNVTTTTTTTTTAICLPSPLCNLIKDRTFQKCHGIFPPDDFYQACVYDSCRVPNSNIECTSLQQYAQLCAAKGVCIEWRDKALECKLTCPSNKVYNACGPVLQKTCQTMPKEDAKMKNDIRFAEGCFCPEGTILHSPAIDICVSHCGCVGPDNVPRKFGEVFQLGCLNCVCRKGGSGLICQTHKCAKLKTVKCELEGFKAVRQINASDPCCEETICKCDTSKCITKPPKCGLGYEVVGSIPHGHCCTVYTCVPKNVCVHKNAEYSIGATIFFDKCQNCVCLNSNGSSGAKIQCTNVPCNIYCPMGYKIKKSTNDCCGQCEQTQCVIDDNGGPKLLHPGESMISENDTCRVYSCTIIKNQFISSISQISCPYFNEDKCVPGTVKRLPNGCCKTCIETLPSCKLQQTLDYLSDNNCTSVDKVQISWCEGPCNTRSIYSAAASKMSHECTCCQEVRTGMKRVKMECRGGRQKEHQYVHVEECRCVSTDCESTHK